jgi:hypothetical protein
MAYYMLHCFGPADQERTSIHRIPQFENVSWNRGARIKGRVPVPVRIYLDPDAPGILLPMYHKGVLLMSIALITALQSAGVTNLELFDAVLVDEANGREYANYKLVNIVGAIAAADLGKSVHVAHGAPLFDVDFDSLTIDEKRTRGALMFRLAENVSGIVVHDSVKDAVLKAGIEHLDFVPPSKWVG